MSNEQQTSLINLFKNCLNILRDNEGLTGEKALRTLSYLLTLKLLEPQFESTIDIDNYNYDLSDFEDDMVLTYRNKLLELVRFSCLANEKEENILHNMRCLWDYILSVHPSTKNIFLKGKNFDIEYCSTYKKLINKINAIDLTAIKHDILGAVYEEVIQDIMTGKVLGQFFTQSLVKRIMVDLIDPQINQDGTIESCCDPTMGTGGFLITYLQHLLKQANERKIKPNWDYIVTEGIYGKELEPDTYQLAVSNMLIASGHMFNKLERGDSIRQPITRKFDNILANPPFGIKGLRYNDFTSSLKGEYVPIKTDNAVSLFIQAMIYMLKIGGKCAVVLPDGQDIFSKTNKTLIAIREYLLKTCDLQKIIYLPSGIFTYTSIKTCIFYFVKKVEGVSVLETKVKTSKTQKEIGRTYKFTAMHQTKEVQFHEYDQVKDCTQLLVRVSVDKIMRNSYALNYTEYVNDETEEYKDDIVVKTLGEVCEINNGNRIVKKQVATGEYPVLGGGGFTSFYTNKYSREGKTCKISREGMSLHNCVMLLNQKYFLNSQAFTIKSTNENVIIDEYLWYYLDNIKEQVFKCGRGTAQKAIDIHQFKSIKIPIPSLERQKEIVKYLDFIYEKANKTSNEKIAELKQLNEFCLNNQKIFGENVVKELGEISIINPENMKSGQYTKINYIDIASVKGGQILELQKLTNDFPSRAKRIVKKGDILYSSVRPNLKGYVYISDDIQNGIASTGFANIRVKEPNTILSKYLYYIMTSHYISDDLISKAKGAQYPAVSFDDFKTIKIPVPSIERQTEIVEYCEYNDTLIKQLEKEIENNKKQAQQFITGIVKAQVQTEEQSDTSSVNI